MSHTIFKKRISVEQIEEDTILAPKFDTEGLIPVITTDAIRHEVLMHGYMNEESFELSIKTGEAHYYSRSRETIWHKGETSGLIQTIVEMRIDDDQDAVWLRVNVKGKGASCHVGYRSCFYRSIPIGVINESITLTFEEKKKIFDPLDVYGDAENPTKI